ncbi:MAG: hypothetical protein KGJ13_01935 [Patescibacteria group bacterium]|nr:hypothetical protein [Patescibacteria group bacterium]
MLYDLYFHDDFDGRAAGAVMLAFLRSRGDDIGHYVPVQYDILPEWSKEGFFEKNKLVRGRHNPAIVVDFLFHPKAAWWFDHHPTTWRNESWRKRFKPSKFQHYDPSYKSACHLVEAALKKDFNWKPPKHFKELVEWLDIYDGANFKSPEQTFDLGIPGLALGAFVGYEQKWKPYMTHAWFIRQIAERSFLEILEEKDVKAIIRTIAQDIERGKLFYRNHLKLVGNTVITDLGAQRFAQLRFFPFSVYPKAHYGMRIRKEKKGWYHFSVGVNPWRRGKKTMHIGEMLEKNFPGGGGHRGVGGAEFKTRKEALAAAEQVIRILNGK